MLKTKNKPVVRSRSGQTSIDALYNLGYEFNENGKMSETTNPLGHKEVVITPRPITTVSELPKGNVEIYREGKQDNGEVNLPDVVVTGEMPRSYMGIPVDVYHSDLSRRMYEDRNKAGRDIALLGAATLAPELGPVISAIGKAFTPSTYTNWLIPQIASKFGMSAPTAAKLTSLVGAGADMTLAGYFAREGYKDIKDAIQHPENLLSWTDYGKLGLDAAMMFGPLSEAGKTASALNRNFRIPFLIDARHSNRYFNWANNTAEKLLSRLENNWFEKKGELGQEVNRHIRGLAYRPLNFVAGLGLKSKSWQPAIKEAAKEGVQTSIDIFNKYYKPVEQIIHKHPTDVGKAEDYTRNLTFSYLPWDKEGILFGTASGHTIRIPTTWTRFRWSIGLPGYNPVLSKGKLPASLNMGQNQRIPKNESPLYKMFREINFYNESPELWGSVAIHETNHEFTKDPTLEKAVSRIRFGSNRTDSRLDRAYLSSNDKSGKLSEKSAINALLRHYLGLTPREIEKLPAERFIYIDKNGKVRTIFDEDKFIDIAGSGYSEQYSRNIKAVLEMLKDENKAQGGAGMSEVFPIFAEKWANAIRDALLHSYKKGGKL